MKASNSRSSQGPWPRWGRVSPQNQKAFIIKQDKEGTPVAEICRKAGISQATYFNWKKRGVDDVTAPPTLQLSISGGAN